jgi:hypothetical protein
MAPRILLPNVHVLYNVLSLIMGKSQNYMMYGKGDFADDLIR